MENWIILLLDLFGTAVFAVTGAVQGIRHRLDIFGVTVLACCVGVGGGIIRDLFVQRLPGVLHKHVYALPCIIGSAMYLAFIRLEVSDVIATEGGKTAIYAVSLGLDGFHGISPTGDGVIQSYLPDLSTPGAVKTGEVELVAGVALKNTLKAAVLGNIAIAAA